MDRQALIIVLEEIQSAAARCLSRLKSEGYPTAAPEDETAFVGFDFLWKGPESLARHWQALRTTETSTEVPRLHEASDRAASIPLSDANVGVTQ